MESQNKQKPESFPNNPLVRLFRFSLAFFILGYLGLTSIVAFAEQEKNQSKNQSKNQNKNQDEQNDSDESLPKKPEFIDISQSYFSLYLGLSKQYLDNGLDVAKKGFNSTASVYTVLGRYSSENPGSPNAIIFKDQKAVLLAGFTTYSLGGFYSYSSDTVNTTFGQQDLSYEAWGLEVSCRFSIFRLEGFNTFMELGLGYQKSSLLVKSNQSSVNFSGDDGLSLIGNPGVEYMINKNSRVQLIAYRPFHLDLLLGWGYGF